MGGQPGVALAGEWFWPTAWQWLPWCHETQSGPKTWPCLPLQPHLSPLSTYLLAHSRTLVTLAFLFLRDTELLPYLTSLPRCCSLCLGHIPAFFPWLVCPHCQVPFGFVFFLTSGCAESLLFRGYSLVAVHGLLIGVVSLVRLQFKHHFLQEVFPDLSN